MTSPGGATSIANGRKLLAHRLRDLPYAVAHYSASKLTAGLGNATANLFSDIEIHHMGTVLADNVPGGAVR